jgi:predicted  nucleic acid-binding Zn-ribbon protein
MDIPSYLASHFEVLSQQIKEANEPDLKDEWRVAARSAVELFLILSDLQSSPLLGCTSSPVWWKSLTALVVESQDLTLAMSSLRLCLKWEKVIEDSGRSDCGGDELKETLDAIDQVLVHGDVGTIAFDPSAADSKLKLQKLFERERLQEVLEILVTHSLTLPADAQLSKLKVTVTARLAKVAEGDAEPWPELLRSAEEKIKGLQEKIQSGADSLLNLQREKSAVEAELRQERERVKDLVAAAAAAAPAPTAGEDLNEMRKKIRSIEKSNKELQEEMNGNRMKLEESERVSTDVRKKLEERLRTETAIAQSAKEGMAAMADKVKEKEAEVQRLTAELRLLRETRERSSLVEARKAASSLQCKLNMGVQTYNGCLATIEVDGFYATSLSMAERSDGTTAKPALVMGQADNGVWMCPLDEQGVFRKEKLPFVHDHAIRVRTSCVSLCDLPQPFLFSRRWLSHPVGSTSPLERPIPLCRCCSSLGQVRSPDWRVTRSPCTRWHSAPTCSRRGAATGRSGYGTIPEIV